ncbi:hypothetical protein SISSUDRAFT_1057481 [Sistotremastrum suecicum HHB10207 ss-3]|uniref:Proteasome assembly chaperone 1 n=1 Tax=Sistotremastrum suecicum HHB10207 ss-3 TaxID=1314776 RepID=A0A166I728_9AGAM|nr:hypothetical protein SISSUDRAFT_1057481 [Sistotremastrum suecicum HHB10207 ss-3]
MDHNPLADRPPPRHAYESDSEDEDGPRPVRGQITVPDVVVEWNPKPAPILTLLGAFGPVAKVWRKTIDLDPWQPVGKVIMADFTVAYIYQRESTIILISEQSTSIPTLLLTPFARQVLTTIKPSRTVVLDSYPLPSYITSSSAPTSVIRYLSSTSSPTPSPSSRILRFDPPNLISSASAPFLLQSNRLSIPCTALLLPGAHILPPPPTLLHFSPGPVLDEEWEPGMMEEVKLAAALVLAVDVGIFGTNTGCLALRQKVPVRPRGDLGDGGMFI